MTDGRIFFDHPVKNIPKIATGQGHDYSTGCLRDYNFSKNYSKMIAIDLSKQQALDADPKSINKLVLQGNLDRGGQKAMHFIILKPKEIVLDFSQGTVRML